MLAGKHEHAVRRLQLARPFARLARGRHPASTSTRASPRRGASAVAGLGLVRDETWFVGALIQRDNVMPSAIGNSIAFLHTLHRHPEQVVKPFMVLGRSREGVDFNALDGKPTHLFFVLGLKYDELHLPWLAKLVQMPAQADVLPSLLEASDADAIYGLLREAERRLEPALAAIL